MKLHLPTRLRKALLSCLAIAVPALSSTLATGSVVLAGFCSFSALYADEEEEKEEEEEEVFNEFNKVPDSWKNLNQKENGDLTNFDTSRVIKDIGGNDKPFGNPDSTGFGSIYFVWDDPASNGNYTLKSYFTEKPEGVDGDLFEIKYKTDYTNGTDSTVGYDWSDGDSFRTFRTTEQGENKVNATDGKDILLPAKSIAHQKNPNIEGGTITGVFYGQTNNGEKGQESTGENSTGKAGAAVFLSSPTNSNTSSDPQPPPSNITHIAADFIGNSLGNEDNPRGAAIYVAYSYGDKLKSIKGNFIGNHLNPKDKSFGGAILNWGRIEEVEGTFIGNYIEYAGTAGKTVVGGAIANGSEDLAGKDTYLKDGEPPTTIETLKGYFIGNYVYNGANVESADVIAGAIANYGRIGLLEGVFIGNYAYSENTANSGVIRNYSRKDNDNDGRVAIIGAKKDEYDESKADVPVFKGIFIGNYAQGVKGDGTGGVMRNNGSINGAIAGLFIGNYATTTGEMIAADTKVKNGDKNYGGLGEYDYYKKKENYLANRQNRGMAYGGAIYNELKIDSGDNVSGDADQVHVGNINSTFIENYVASKYGEAFGGAIYNQDATINDIVSVFQGNHAVSDFFAARGGALYNNMNTRSASISNIGKKGDISWFEGNYAQSKLAQGGAIFVSTGAKISNVYAEFTGNHVRSEIAEEDGFSLENKWYFEIRNSQDTSLSMTDGYKLRPTAQGGALYVADAGSLENITGDFRQNFAETTGVGTLTVSSNGEYTNEATTGKSANEIETAQGGAIYVSKIIGKRWDNEKEKLEPKNTKDETAQNETNIANITGDFVDNYVQNLGNNKNEYAGVKAVAQGGAIYVNEGKIKNVLSNFIGNEARGHSTGSEEETVQGGAIYVYGAEKENADYKGSIDDIGGLDSENKTVYYVSFENNKVEAKGQGKLLTKQDTQGGAIYVSDYGSLGNIYADFKNNSIDAQLADSGKSDGGKSDGDVSKTYLTDRNAQGGAIYLNQYAKIGEIWSKEGFDENSITISGDKSGDATNVRAQGGAIYVSNYGVVDNIHADFTNNYISAKLADSENVTKSDLPGTEEPEKEPENHAQGGAIYLNENATVAEIWATKSGFDKNKITMTGNKSGEDTKILVQGGAIYVNKEAHAGSIRANLTNNSAISDVFGAATERVGGGAIYVAEKGYIGDIGHKGSDGIKQGEEGYDPYYLVAISGNSVEANGNGTNLTTQMARGGAILVEEKGKDEYSIKSIYTIGITNNTVTADMDTSLNSNDEVARTARGGAIYVDNRGSIDDIGAYKVAEDGTFSVQKLEAFRGNKVIVEGGNAGNKATLNAQGGALYVAGEATVKNVVANFTDNVVDTSAAEGNVTETVQGGAIFVDSKGSIQDIGRNGGEDKDRGWALVRIDSNNLIAGGNGKHLTDQTVQGGAIYVSQAPVAPASGGETYSIKDIYASSISGNKITADLSSQENKGLTNRTIQGGAIYLSDGGKVKSITQGDATQSDAAPVAQVQPQMSTKQMAKILIESILHPVAAPITATEDRGFVNNKIIVSGGHKANTATLIAQGGALYASFNAQVIENVNMDFLGNTINTTDAHGNKVERLAGGAIYLAGGAHIGGIGTASDQRQIKYNVLEAGGNGTQLEEQRVRGGAIFVGADVVVKEEKQEEKQEEKLSGSLGAIYADITDNAIIAYADKDKNKAIATIDEETLEGNARTLKGGALFLAEGGEIDSIWSGKDSDGFVRNKIVATGGNADNKTTLTAQGGAVYMDDGANTDGIFAGFKDNHIYTTDKFFDTNIKEEEEKYGSADGNLVEQAEGGALYLAAGASVNAIGTDGAAVSISGNSIEVGGKGNNLKTQLVRGGAIYVSSRPSDDKKSVEEIHADIIDNKIVATLGGISESVTSQQGTSELVTPQPNVESRTIQGGAIYLADEGAIGDIKEGNGIKEEIKDGDKTIEIIKKGISYNTIKVTGTGNGSTSLTVQGGALYVASNSEVGNIKADFKGNGITNEGKGNDVSLTYGGAVFVADHGKIGNITGDFTGNYVKNSSENVGNDPVKDYENLQAKGGAVYLAEDGHIEQIGSADSVFLKNYAEGSGQVRGGAILVSKATVGDIAGTFIGNYAKGTESLVTYGGGIRFDDSVLIRLESNFYSNYTTGMGGALSLTDKGIIYEVTGDFKGNYSAVNGGAVEDLGRIGLRGYAVLEKGENMLKNDYSNVKRNTDDNKLLETQRDSTDTLYALNGDTYKNRLGRAEYDGSFTGGFVNSNFLYNRVYERNSQGDVDAKNKEYFRGAGIYTDQDLFITVNSGQEVIMSGNAIERGSDGKVKVRSAIYVDNHNYEAQEGDYESLVIYMVAQENGVLRIDDNIRGHDESTTGLVVRLRGYTDKVYDREGNYYAKGLGTAAYDKSGLIILNNRVERAYTVMDDVTLYIGYKARTFNDKVYLKNSEYNIENKKYKAYLIGDEGEDIIMDGRRSEYLNEAGVAYKINQEDKLAEVDDGRKELYHQSDVFRDSFFEARSGVVALTETTYATKNSNGRYTDMIGEVEEKEAFTEYLFGGFVAYGADYNYGKYGTDSDDVKKNYASSLMTKAGEYGKKDYAKYAYRMGSEEGRYASFEFGMDLSADEQYTLELANRYYYKDRNGNPTEIATHLNEKTGVEEPHDFYTENGNKVRVKHQMAMSDVLTVFAVWDSDKDDLMWTDADGGKSSVSRGRVTLNGLTVVDDEAWRYTKASVNGPQWDKDGNPETTGAGYNRDLYVQLINYRLVSKDGKTLAPEVYEKFYAKFDEEDDGTLDNGYHLTRLSDHFDLVHNAEWFMKGSDILADEIELATTVTKDDSIRIVGWRDHLAEWAEHEASWDGKTMKQATDENGKLVFNEDGTARMVAAETEGLYTGKKHFLLDQNVYYLNRDINLPTNPTDDNHDGVGAQMWGKDLTIEGVATNKELNLQRHNMLSLVIEDQAVRLQNFTLVNVQEKKKDSGRGYMQNEGDLTFDTMRMETSLIVNNAGNKKGKDHTLENQLTVTGVMDIDFTITTEKVNGKQQHGKLVINNTSKVSEKNLESRPASNHQELKDPETSEQPDDPTLADGDDSTLAGGGDSTLAGGGDSNDSGTDAPLDPEATESLAQIVSNEEAAEVSLTSGSATTTYSGDGSTSTTTPDTSVNPTPTDKVIGETVVHITGVVEHQNITHQGEDQMVLKQEEKVAYNGGDVKNPVTENDNTKTELDTWYIETGKVGKDDIRETFTTNTYLDTTKADHKTATEQFLNFRDNALHMEGGAFNLGDMYTHRLVLRHFYVSGGAVFVNHSLIDMENEVMGGIDVSDVGKNTEQINKSNGNAKYAGDGTIAASETAASSGTGDGLIWLQGFTLKGTARNNKTILHVKFVDDGVGNAVKDGMGIANGSKESGRRIMPDGDYMYNWLVTYNDKEAENDKDPYYKGKEGIRGMYTFRRLGPAPEQLPGPVTDLTGSYVTMMQVYNYSFEHSDLFSPNMNAAREQQLYSDHYSAVDVKGKNSVAVADSCPPSTVGLRRGLWLHTYASAEKMPLRNGPEVSLNMYGGLIGGDTALQEHRSGWASVWSFYGGYLGSTQRYESVRIRQNGAAIGATGTFYKKRFYTAVTASVGVAQATSTGRAGSEDFGLLMGGIASRSGYSFDLDDGNYVLQPNLQISYTLFNNLGYTNASGHSVSGKPTGVLQLHPFLKLIKNTDCTWKPYGKVGVVYNAFGKTSFSADGVSMPSMSIKPYVEYSLGAQRHFDDRYTLYGEVTGRNGGRNGGEVSIGIRRAW